MSLTYFDHLNGNSAMNWSFATNFGDWIQSGLHHSWNWLNQLSYQEWFLLLGIVASLGFLCMRGYGSRGSH
jgi:hypothetical protein